MKRVIFSLFLLAAAGTVWWLTEGMEKRRFPASADNQYDLSRLSETEFEKSATELIATSTRLKEISNNLYEISFAHFLGPLIPTSVCSKYPTIQLVFAAEGMAVSGEPPQLIVEYICTTNASAERIQTLIIDTKAIADVNPQAEEYPITDAYAFGNHMEDFWPAEFYLSSVRLVDETDLIIEATASDFRRIRGDVLRLQFP